MLRKMVYGEWTELGIADLLKVRGEAVRVAIDALVADGLLVACPPDKVFGRRLFYKHGPHAARLIDALLLKRIPRAKADRLVADLIERAKAVNARPELFVGVATLRAFGSYITDAPDLGDIDIAVDLVRKEQGPKGSPRETIEWNRARARASGRQSMSFVEEICYGDIEVRKLLKARVAYVSLHDGGELARLGVESRVLFEAKSESFAGYFCVTEA